MNKLKTWLLVPDSYTGEIEVYAKEDVDEILPKWLSVSPETMPERKCIATYKNSHGKRRTVVAVYCPRFTVESNGEEDNYDEYNEKSDEYFFKEGWYECQENWGEYAMIYINDGEVTHWQPLPPAPKEGEG